MDKPIKKLTHQEIQHSKPSVSQVEAMPRMPVVLVLDGLRSLYNIGSIFRTADALLIEKIYLCGICGTPPNKQIEKLALGAVDTLVPGSRIISGSKIIAVSFTVMTVPGTGKRSAEPEAGVHFGFPIAVDAQDGRTAWVVPARADSERMAIDGGLFVAQTSGWRAVMAGFP